jgi:hypothetical protein
MIRSYRCALPVDRKVLEQPHRDHLQESAHRIPASLLLHLLIVLKSISSPIVTTSCGLNLVINCATFLTATRSWNGICKSDTITIRFMV